MTQPARGGLFKIGICPDQLVISMREWEQIPYQACAELGRGPVLILAPHPDDEVFGCAGALLQHVAAGDPVQVVVVTDGAWNEGADYAELRRMECRAAASVLGYGIPEFWNLPDRGLRYGERLIRRISEAISTRQAEFVYAPSSREIHPDHRALALAAAESVRRCDRPITLVMYEVGMPLHPNRLLDITATLERKRTAMACFASQLDRQSYDAHILALNRFRTYTLPPSVAAAEAYRVVTRQELRRDPVRALRQDNDSTFGWTADASLGLPLVSVIIRRREARYPEETLAAIANQTYPHIEILIADPSGSGATALPAWAGCFPLRQTAAGFCPSGPDCWNQALGDTRGDYVAVLDEHEVPHPEHFAQLVAALRTRPTARCARRAPAAAPLAATIRDCDAVPLGSLLFERSLFDRGCRFDAELPACHDRDFVLQLAEHTELLDLGPAEIPGTGDPSRGERGIELEDGELLAKKWQRIRAAHDAPDASGEDCEGTAIRGVIDQLRAELSERDALLDQYRQLISRLEQSLRQSEADHAELTNWSRGLKTAVDELQASHSWRITRPLRFMARWMRGENPGRRR